MKRPLGPLALFLVVPGLALFPVLRGQEQFFYRDVSRQYAPIQAQIDRAWSQGELPVWNASTQSGVPLLANLHAGVLAPWAPVFRAFEFHRAYGAMVALAWAAWMAGLYRYLRRRLRCAAALVGSITGGVAGVVLGATSYLPLLAGLACLPWQLLALREPRPLRRVVTLAALFTLQLLFGDPSTALMGGLVCLAAAWVEGPHGAIGTLVWSGVVALGWSAVQLLPAWSLFLESARAQSSLETRLAWSFHPSRTLEWVVRLPFGELLKQPYFTRSDLAVGPDAQPFLLEHGWGLMALLMLGSALTVRGPLRRLGITLVGLGFMLSLGRHLGPFQEIYAIPPLSLFRFPERYGVLAALGAALLTAHGASAMLESSRARFRWALAWLGMGACLAAAAWKFENPAMWLTAALLGAGGLSAAALARTWWAWLLGVLAFGALDARLAVQASVLTLPSEPLPVVAQLAGEHRVWRENAVLRGLERPVRGRDAFAAERRLLHATFASATPGLHNVAELGGYSPVALRRWQRVIRATANRPDLLSSLFDACWLVSTQDRAQTLPGWRQVSLLSDDTALFRAEACRGRAWTVREVVEVQGTEEAVQHLVRPGFDPYRTATREDAYEPLPELGSTVVSLLPRKRSSELELTVEPTAQWVMVVVSETWAPGWRAQVDGEERPVELLDGTLLGVAVPPGGRTLALRYEEPFASAGLGLSMVTLFTVLLVWLRRRRGR